MITPTKFFELEDFPRAFSKAITIIVAVSTVLEKNIQHKSINPTIKKDFVSSLNLFWPKIPKFPTKTFVGG